MVCRDSTLPGGLFELPKGAFHFAFFPKWSPVVSSWCSFAVVAWVVVAFLVWCLCRLVEVVVMWLLSVFVPSFVMVLVSPFWLRVAVDIWFVVEVGVAVARTSVFSWAEPSVHCVAFEDGCCVSRGRVFLVVSWCRTSFCFFVGSVVLLW